MSKRLKSSLDVKNFTHLPYEVQQEIFHWVPIGMRYVLRCTCQHFKKLANLDNVESCFQNLIEFINGHNVLEQFRLLKTHQLETQINQCQERLDKNEKPLFKAKLETVHFRCRNHLLDYRIGGEGNTYLGAGSLQLVQLHPNSHTHLQLAAFNCNIPLIDQLWNNKASSWSDKFLTTFNHATANTNQEKSVLVLEKLRCRNRHKKTTWFDQSCWNMAAVWGNTKVLHWAKRRRFKFQDPVRLFMLLLESRNCSVNSVNDFFLDQTPLDQEAILNNLDKLFLCHLTYGHSSVDILQWLTDKWNSLSDLPKPWPLEWMDKSLDENMSLATFQFLLSHLPPNWETNTAVYTSTLSIIVGIGKFEFLEILPRPTNLDLSAESSIMENACSVGIEMAQYCRKAFNAPWSNMCMFECLCAKWSWNDLKWAVANGCPWGGDDIVELARNYNLDVVKWAVANGCSPRPIQYAAPDQRTRSDLPLITALHVHEDRVVHDPAPTIDLLQYLIFRGCEITRKVILSSKNQVSLFKNRLRKIPKHFSPTLCETLKLKMKARLNYARVVHAWLMKRWRRERYRTIIESESE